MVVSVKPRDINITYNAEDSQFYFFILDFFLSWTPDTVGYFKKSTE